MKRFITSKYQQIKALYTRFERWLMPATLVIGFLVDYVTFTTIQIEITLGLLLIYWLLTGLAIALINFYDAGKLPQKFNYLRLFAPLLIQFTLGALLGSSLVFYWFSGAFSVSWPFIFIIAILMILNEVFRHAFLKPVLQISLYFFITISLFSITGPYLFHSLSAWLFIGAGVLSLFLFYYYLNFLFPINQDMRRQKRQLLSWILMIFLVMNFLYFTNIIPPIPLSLREAGLYHSISVSKGSYKMLGETETFWQWLTPGQVVHLVKGQKLYFYTAIFAPPKLTTTIVHDWQHYDKEKKEWVSYDQPSFAIFGGRKEGFKGYSFNFNLEPGPWRIYVKNQRGQVLGRMEFIIENSDKKPELKETVR